MVNTRYKQGFTTFNCLNLKIRNEKTSVQIFLKHELFSTMMKILF